MTMTKWMTGSMIAAVAAVFVSGCSSVMPDHTFVSQDRHVYHSTVSLPTNVSVVEPYSGEVLWSMQVPVGHKLVLDFDRRGETEVVSVSRQPATSMSWSLRGPTKESGKVALNGTPVAMRVSYRKPPEFPEGKTPESLLPEAPAPIQPDLEAPAAPDATPEANPEATPDAAVPANGEAVEQQIQDEVKAAEPIEATDPADAAMTK